MLTLDLAPRALKFLRTLDAKHCRQVVLSMLQLLQTPAPSDARPLTGFPYSRVDAGEYRIVYRVEGTLLQVPLIGKRNDAEVYKNLRRLLG